MVEFQLPAPFCSFHEMPWHVHRVAVKAVILRTIYVCNSRRWTIYAISLKFICLTVRTEAIIYPHHGSLHSTHDTEYLFCIGKPVQEVKWTHRYNVRVRRPVVDGVRKIIVTKHLQYVWSVSHFQPPIKNFGFQVRQDDRSITPNRKWTTCVI